MLTEKISEILEAASRPTLKTRIRQFCGMSNSTLNTYLNQLLECGLLDAFPAMDLHSTGSPSRHKMFYQTSRKGKEFQRKLGELSSILKPKSYSREQQWLTSDRQKPET